MSLRELARRVDVSASSVSQIETGRIQPSVRTLYAIVSELGLSLDEMFELVGSAEVHAAVPLVAAAAVDERRAGAALVRRSAKRRVIGSEAGVARRRIAAWDDPDVEFTITVYRPGSSSVAESDPISHDACAFGLLLGGRLTVTVDGEDHLLGPGDSITFQSSTPHRLFNRGEVEARAVWVTHRRPRAREAPA
jgi:transcriptional regulator with XRE-family HTH domain